MKIEYTGTLDIDGLDKIKKRHGIEAGGPAQQFLDMEVIRQCEPYVPYDSGNLTRSAWTATRIGSGEVVYPGPYAHYQYYGEVYGPSFPCEIGGEMTFRSRKGIIKKPTGRKLKYNKDVHPLAGSFWFERMKADKGGDILRALKNFLGVKE